jgi:hypothetical protein
LACRAICKVVLFLLSSVERDSHFCRWRASEWAYSSQEVPLLPGFLGPGGRFLTSEVG